jgi:hypothetical protein
MRHVKPAQNFQAYLLGQKLISIVEAPAQLPDVNEQFRKLVEYTRQYRHYQKQYFAKLKKNEFAKDEQHFMMKYQEKIDTLLKSIPF